MILQRIVVVGVVMKQYIRMYLLIVTMVLLTGCTVVKTTSQKVDDVEYHIVSIEETPKELEELIETNKSTKMNLTYSDQGLVYIITGYGAQKTSGYSVEVLEVYETENTVVVDTNLLGPSPDEEIIESATFPYVIILIEEVEKPVIFD